MDLAILYKACIFRDTKNEPKRIKIECAFSHPLSLENAPMFPSFQVTQNELNLWRSTYLLELPRQNLEEVYPIMVDTNFQHQCVSGGLLNIAWCLRRYHSPKSH